MYKEVAINGVNHFVSFGMNALAQFTRQAGLSLKELGDLEEHLDLQNTLVLVWCGLADGYRKARKDGLVKGQFLLTVEDIGDLLDSDSTALSNVMSVFNEAMPEPGNAKPQAPTKRKSRRKPVGAN